MKNNNEVAKVCLITLRAYLFLFAIYKFAIVIKKYYLEDIKLFLLFTVITIITILFLIRKNKKIKKLAPASSIITDEKKYEMEYDLKSVTQELKSCVESGKKIVTLNGKYGSGKTTVINNLDINWPKTHIQLWNLDYEIDKTTYVLIEILNKKVDIKSLLADILLLSVANLVSSNSIFEGLISIIYISALIFNFKIQFALLISKIKLIPFSFISQYIWDEITLYDQVYIFEDLDRINENDQVQVYELIGELNKKTNNSCIIITLDINKLTPNSLENFHKLESVILNMKYEYQTDLIYNLSPISLTDEDCLLYNIFWGIIEQNDSFRLNSDWRYVQYCNMNIAKYLNNGYTHPIDFSVGTIMNYYFGTKFSTFQSIYNDPDVKRKLDNLMEGERNLINTIGMTKLIHHKDSDGNFQKINYINEHQLTSMPKLFNDYICVEGSSYQYRLKTAPIESVINLFESNYINESGQLIAENTKNIANELSLYDLVFQDIVFNYFIQNDVKVNYLLLQKKINIAIDLLAEIEIDKYIRKLSLHIKNMNSEIKILENRKYKMIKDSNIQYTNSFIYNDEPIFTTKDLVSFEASIMSEVKPNVYSYLIDKFFQSKLEDESFLFRLALSVLINPDLIKYHSYNSPVKLIAKKLSKNLGQEHIKFLHMYVANNKEYESIEYIVNEWFIHSNLRVKFKN